MRRALYGFLFELPASLERVAFGAEVCDFGFDLAQAFSRGRVFLFLQRLALDFELHGAAQDLVEFGRHGVDFSAQFRGGFVHQIDGFVGQEAVGDVAIREQSRRSPAPRP